MGYITEYKLTITEPKPREPGPTLAEVTEKIERAGFELPPGFEITRQPDRLTKAIDFVDQDTGEFCGYPLREALDQETDSWKWYEYERDMLKLSSQHPGVLFTLHGDGEESGDLWIHYFLDGRGYRENLVITFPPFDPERLDK